MRLRIVSNGHAGGTRVIAADTGEEIRLVTAITWTLNANKDRVAHVTLELLGSHVDVIGEGEVTA